MNFYERLHSIQLFLQDHNVSASNRDRLTHYMKCRWNRDQGHELASIAAGLTPSLRGELCHEATGHALEKVRRIAVPC